MEQKESLDKYCGESSTKITFQAKKNHHGTKRTSR